MKKYSILMCLPMLFLVSACNNVGESSYQEIPEFRLYMDYLDQISVEELKYYTIDESLSRRENEILKEQKRTLEKKIDSFIKENNLYFSSEPTELERLEFLNLINDFIDDQAVNVKIKENVKKMWSLNFSPVRDELRNKFLKASGLKKEDLLTVFQNRIK